jgi:hypothetical protein
MQHDLSTAVQKAHDFELELARANTLLEAKGIQMENRDVK